MDICTWFNESGVTSTYVIHNSKLARKWLKLQSELTNIPIVKWNHHRCSISDYKNQLDSWQHLKALALSLGITVTAEPDQTSINLVHRYFVDAIRVDRARAKLWVELNTLLHYHEYLLQNRGASTSIDYTQTPMQPRFLIAEDGLPEPIQAGGLYLMYSQLGRNWEEIWRAGDFDVPIHHIGVQNIYSEGVYMASTTLPANQTIEWDVYSRRTTEWPFKWEDRQNGLYRIGSLLGEPSTPAWYESPITRCMLKHVP